MVRQTVHFSGDVQGVGFRFTVVNLARNHAVAGYVQNLPDGRVKLVAEGDQSEVKALVADVQRRMDSHIRETKVDESSASGEFGQPVPGSLTVQY